MATGISSGETDLDSLWSFINTEEKGSLAVQEAKKDNTTGQDIKKEVQTGKEPENESAKEKATEISEVITTNKTEPLKPNNSEELKKEGSQQETKTDLNSFWSFIKTDGKGSDQGSGKEPANESAKGKATEILEVITTNKTEQLEPNNPEELKKQGSEQETKTNLNSFWSFINSDEKESEKELKKYNEAVQDLKKEVQTVEEQENKSAEEKARMITDVMKTITAEQQTTTNSKEVQNQGNKQETKQKVYDISTVFKRLDYIESFGVDDNNDEDDVTNYMNEEDDIDKEIFADFEKKETNNSGDKDFYPEVKEEVLFDPEDPENSTDIWKALGFPDIDYMKASYALISLVGSVLIFNGLVDIFKAVLNINRVSPMGN